MKPEAWVNIQPHIAVWICKSYPDQHTTPHCSLDIKSYPGMFYVEHTTPHSSAILMPLIIILHIEHAAGRGWSFSWGGL